MKMLIAKGALRSAVKNIVMQLPDLKSMHAKYKEGYTKYSKNAKDLEQFERGCKMLKSWLK